MKRAAFVLALIGAVISACGGPAGPGVTIVPATPTTPPSKPTTPAPTPEPTGTHIPVDIPPAQREAIKALAAQLGIDAGQIELVSIEAVDWPNGCLGVVRMGVLCTQNIVPGFRIILKANGQTYEFHTNSDGSVVIPAPGAAPGQSDAATEAAKKGLADSLGIPTEVITITSVTPFEWPDACLGVGGPAESCAQVVTPGYLIVLHAQGKDYGYHTNQDGSVVKPATIDLIWHREGGIAGFCDDLIVFRSGEAHASSCRPNGPTSAGKLQGLISDAELADYQSWFEKYGQVTFTVKDPAAADAMTQTLSYFGEGSAQPTEAEQQAMLALASKIYTALQK